MSITKDELREALREVVRDLMLEVLDMHESRMPPPTVVSVHDAAEWLGISLRQVYSLNLPRSGRGMIPYSAVVLRLKDSKRSDHQPIMRTRSSRKSARM